MEPGWVYVLVNSSMPGLSKVGRTSRPPAERVAELSSATGVATPFVLAFDQQVADSCAAERAVHAELDRRGLRVASNREFFRGPPSEIVRVVLDVAAPRALAPSSPGPTSAGPVPRPHPAQTLIEAGDCCLAGAGPALKDTGEAIRLYRLAASRGALSAYARLGRLYVELYTARPNQAARRHAMDALKQGAKLGDLDCYAEMAGLFAAERQTGHFATAWTNFFDGQDLAAPDEKLAASCCRYIDMCLAIGLRPAPHPAIQAASPIMIARLLSELEQARGTPAQRRVACTLRWAYLNSQGTRRAASAPPPATAMPLGAVRTQPCPGPGAITA